MENKEWNLQDLRIDFKPGYEFQKTVDRYEGRITFSNNEGESFTFKVDQFQAQKFLDIVGAEIIKTASTLGDKIAKSIFLTLKPTLERSSIQQLIVETDHSDKEEAVDLEHEHYELGGEGGEE